MLMTMMMTVVIIVTTMCIFIIVISIVAVIALIIFVIATIIFVIIVATVITVMCVSSVRWPEHVVRKSLVSVSYKWSAGALWSQFVSINVLSWMYASMYEANAEHC